MKITNCPLCGSNKLKLVYFRIVNTYSKLGKIKVNNVICKKCGLMFLNPRPSSQSIQKYYASEIVSSSTTFHSNASGARHEILIKARKKFLLKHLPRKKTGMLLEIGSAKGDFIAALKLSNWKIYGLEPSKISAKKAQKRGLKIINDTIENVNFQNRKFDVICCISAFEHMSNPEIVIKKIHDLLKPNGKLMIEVPDSTKPILQLSEYYTFEHLTHFTKSTLEYLLAQNDIKINYFDQNNTMSNLRIWGQVKKGYSQKFVPKNDSVVLLSSLSKYKMKRKQIEQKTKKRFIGLIKKWKKSSSRIGIFGAGLHSIFLLDVIDFKNTITCFLDNDLKKQNSKFLKWNVYSPELITKLNLDVIIISSKSFHQEIFNQLSHYKKSGIEIIDFYK